ncbi:MAG: uroporphyrinogen decarboxylase family protein, partial [Candidatus Latescibacterota bacterium]
YAVDHDTVSRVIGRPTFVRNKIAVQVALWEGRRDEVAEGLKADVVEFYRKIDCADLLLPKEAQLLPPRDYEPERPRRLGDDRWEDRHGRVYQAVWSVNEIQCIHDPNPPARRSWRVEDFEGEPEVRPPDPSVFEVFDHVAAALGTERYVAGPTGGITALTLLGGTEEGLVRCIEHPEVVLAASRRSTAVQNAQDEWYLRPGAPGVLMEQDLAGSNGPLVSPAMFRELAFPFLAERVQHVKARVPQVIFHNCGNNLPLMGMFAECGIDCYQSLQTTAGMEVGRLKALFGDRLCFWGGVPVELLIDGTPDQVRQAVQEAMERGAPGGGFILGPSHSVAFGTRYENFMAMLEEFVRRRDQF